MLDVVSMLLLIAAESEPSGIPVIKVPPSLAETAEAQQQAGSAAADSPQPEILDRSFGLATDDYPAESLRAHEEGTVRISLEVDPAGKPTGCTLIQTSGHPRLDEKTCQVAMERASFRPVRDKQGKPVASIWQSPPVAWRIPKVDYASLPPTEAYHATTIQIGADGTFGECTSEASGNILMRNSCEQAKASYAKNAKEAARWWKSLTFVIATSNKDTPPEVGKPAWGSRQSRILSAQLHLSGIMKPVSCETILTEGWSLGGTACPPPDAIALTPPNPDWSKARTSYTEYSTFGQPR